MSPVYDLFSVFFNYILVGGLRVGIALISLKIIQVACLDYASTFPTLLPQDDWRQCARDSIRGVGYDNTDSKILYMRKDRNHGI